MRRALGHLPQVRHLFGHQEQPHIGPALFAFRCANPYESPFIFEDFETVAMFGRGHDGGFRREFLSKSEGCWTRERLTDSR